jgi:hypothetical protein
MAVAGGDHDLDAIWLWNKVADRAHMPVAYTEALQQARWGVLVRSTGDGSDCPVVGEYRGLPINATMQRVPGTKPYWDQVAGELSPPKAATARGMQWEWGLPDGTLEAVRDTWCAAGQPAERLLVVEGGTVDLYRLIAQLWIAYLNKNGCQVRGVTFNGYWTAHPVYERAAGLLPVHFYRFATIQEAATELVERYLSAFSRGPATVCAFTNRIGSPQDPDDLRGFLAEYGLAQDAWFSIGPDCPDGRCHDVYGGEIPPPHLKVAKWLHGAPYWPDCRAFVPLTVEEVAAQVGGVRGCSCRWDVHR